MCVEGNRVASDDKCAAFSVEEVSRHCTQTDCWVIIHGKVYDVTKYVPSHPGGALIYVKAGGDCSQLFDSYHVSQKARYSSHT
jgi:acyl-lipid (8-3)-desaturase